MRLVLSLLLLSFVQAGKVCLPKGWVLEWTFPTTTTVAFKLALDEDTSANYGWAGIGFKYTQDYPGMIGADIANLIFEGDRTDRFSIINGLPELDIDLGGTDDLVNLIGEFQDNAWVFTWTRPVNSGDEYDKIYTIGDDYILLWACGLVSEEGIQLKHFTGDRSLVPITLTADFEFDCEEVESLV